MGRCKALPAPTDRLSVFSKVADEREADIAEGRAHWVPGDEAMLRLSARLAHAITSSIHTRCVRLSLKKERSAAVFIGVKDKAQMVFRLKLLA